MRSAGQTVQTIRLNGRAVTMNTTETKCINCGATITREKDDPWFHVETEQERCDEMSDDFAVSPDDML